MSKPIQSSWIYTTQNPSKNMERFFTHRYGLENTGGRSLSGKLKYTSNSKLTKSSLFKSISGKKIRNEQKVIKKINLEIMNYHKSKNNRMAPQSQMEKTEKNQNQMECQNGEENP